MKRGWFTYTDLCVLLEQSAWSQALAAIYQHFTKVRGGFEFDGAVKILMWLGGGLMVGPLRCIFLCVLFIIYKFKNARGDVSVLY